MPVLRARIDRAIETREPYMFQFRCTYPNDELVWAEVRGKPLYNTAGEATRRRRDAQHHRTAPRRADCPRRPGTIPQPRRNRKGRLISVDDQGKIQYANASCAAMFGYERAKLTGSTLSRSCPSKSGAFHQVLRELQKHRPETAQLEWHRAQRDARDGAELPIEMSLSVTRAARSGSSPPSSATSASARKQRV